MARLWPFGWQPGLLPRLAVALALVGLLPVAFASRRLIGINESAMTEQVQNTHSLAARTTAEQIGQFLDSRLALAAGLAADPALADAGSPAARELLRRSLAAWDGLGVLGLAIVDAAGREALRAQLAEPEPRRRVEAALARPPGPVVEPLVEGERWTLRLEAPLAANGARVWLVCDGREIDNALDTYELGADAELMLVDAERRALAGRQEMADDFPPRVLEYALSNWLSGTEPDFVSPRTGERFIGAWAPVPLARWAVLSRQPLAVAQQVARRMQNQSRWAVGGAAVLIVLLSGAAWASVIRPIRQLAAAQRRLAGLPGAAGGSEIGQLKAAFEALEKRLTEQEKLDEVFLGRYQVTDVLGSGAMGTVFRGWDPKLQRPVALKTVRLDRKLADGRRRELVERLLSEAVTVARFNDPNIVSVFDIEDHPEGAYVAMELVDGNSLEYFIWQQGQLPADQVVPLGAAIARGLATAHRLGVIHRDVKPANVLLGGDGSIKVTDFGISELMSAMAPTGDVVFGTPGFVPPETLRGEEYDKSGDLFAMGAVLYACLTGRPPFDGRSVREVVRRTLFGVIEPPGRSVPGVPPELDELVMSLLSRERGNRPGDAAEVAEAFDEMARRHGYVWRPPAVAAAEPPPADEQAASQWIPTTRLEGSADAG